MFLADTLKSEADLKPFAEKVMDSVPKGDLDAAFATMKPYVVLPEAALQSTLLTTKTQRDQFVPVYGRPIGYEFVAMKKLGHSFIRLIYIEKTQKTGMPWTFIFYETKEGWVLNSFFWNDQLAQLFNLS